MKNEVLAILAAEAGKYGFVFEPNHRDAYLSVLGAPFELGIGIGKIGHNLYHLSDAEVDWVRYQRVCLKDIQEKAPAESERMRLRREEIRHLFGKGFTFRSRTAKVWALGCPHSSGEERAVVPAGAVPDEIRVIINKLGLDNCDNGTEDGCVAGTHRIFKSAGMRYSVEIRVDAPITRVVGGEVGAGAGIHWAQGKRHISVLPTNCTVTVRLAEPEFSLPSPALENLPIAA